MSAGIYHVYTYTHTYMASCMSAHDVLSKSQTVYIGNHSSLFTSMITYAFFVWHTYLFLQMPLKCQVTVNLFISGRHIFYFISMIFHAFFLWKTFLFFLIYANSI